MGLAILFGGAALMLLFLWLMLTANAHAFAQAILDAPASFATLAAIKVAGYDTPGFEVPANVKELTEGGARELLARMHAFGRNSA